MSQMELSPQQISDLVGSRHPATGIAFPPAGLQPYHDWLIQTLHRLAEASAGDLRVGRADAPPTAIHLAPGRCSIGGVGLSLAATTIDLATVNNDTALVWVYDDNGNAVASTATAATGWPSAAHLKLAEVTLAGGAVTGILDRRFETVLRV